MSYQAVNPSSNLALWQRGGAQGVDTSRGFVDTGDWTWELYPFAYSFLAPKDSTPQPAPIVDFGLQGLGCGGSCGCGGKCSDSHGLGQGLFNTGLFTSTDPTQWGIGEWATIAGAIYLGSNIFGDAKTAGRKVRSGYKAARRAS
jgi:hypothetical protein